MRCVGCTISRLMSSWPGSAIWTGMAFMACEPRDTRSIAIPKHGGRSWPMTRSRTLSEKLALSILARDGISAIWQLHLAAADAHLTGHPIAAASIVEIADAAEEAWFRAEGARAFAV